ncbi:unnamed protein product [Musa acuminata subsp. burmannicoides]
MVVPYYSCRRHGTGHPHLRRIRQAAAASLLGHLPCDRHGFRFHIAHRCHSCHRQSGTRTKYYHGDGDRLHDAWEASGECGVQDLWIH